MGDAWCFVAIERHNKLVLAFELGKRTVTSATRFITKLAAATDPERRFQLTTDGLKAYSYPVGNILGDRVDYASSSRSTPKRFPKMRGATARPGWRKPSPPQSMGTQTRKRSALRTWNARTLRCACAYGG